jgi:hypothetical protein
MNVFDTDGNYLTSWNGSDGSQSSDGFQIISGAGPTSDGRGFLYVAEETSHGRRIRKFDESGHEVAAWSDDTLGPARFPTSQFHIAADAQGNVYAAETRGPNGNASRVFIYDTLGNYIGQWTVPDDTNPGAPTYLYHIELDGRGHIFVTDSNGRMLEYACPG